uniref:Uncharacterized protein n=1 Tax=Anguilla anguilla TaxID=7936 RepID=A0A0E9TFA2_ANGAN
MLIVNEITFAFFFFCK